VENLEDDTEVGPPQVENAVEKDAPQAVEAPPAADVSLPLISKFPAGSAWRLVTLAATVVIATLFLARFVRVTGGIANRPAPTPAVGSLAVLPFQSAGEKIGQPYVGIAMADAVITKLGHSGKIVTRPTSAVQKYATMTQDSRTAGLEQGVDAVLDGRMQREGDRVRLTVQLTRVRDGVELW